MTEYVKSTNFTSKDSLATGNPLKIVKGTEIDAEFNNIAIAVATKADLLSPVLTGIPLAPTAPSGTFSTQLATTAFVLQTIYPVGSIYINGSVSTNPSSLFGFGTWTAFGTGKVLVGLNGADSSFDVLGETGGSKDSVVVSHTHTGTTGGQSASHTHSQDGVGSSTTPGGQYGLPIPSGTSQTGATSNDHSHSFTTNAAGVSGTNANLQPYVVVNMWLRTA